MDTATLIAVYNEVVTAHGLEAITPTRKTAAGAKKFLAWCELHDVDPERFIMARHNAIGYKFRINLSRMASPKYLGKFRDFAEGVQAGVQGQDKLAADTIDDDRASPELRPLWEQMKQIYQFEPDMCLLQSGEMTGGWNPASPWCRACTMRDACRATLHPTTVATREAHARGV